MAFESINLSPNEKTGPETPKIKLSNGDFVNLENKLATDHNHINKIANKLNAKEKIFAHSVKRAEAVISGIKEVTKDDGAESSHDIEVSSSEFRRFKYAQLDGNKVKGRGEERLVKKMGGEIRSRWIEDNKRIKNLTKKIEGYVASNQRDQETISSLRSELLAAETLLNTHRATIKNLRDDKNISKELKAEAIQYANEDAEQINKLTGVLNMTESIKTEKENNIENKKDPEFKFLQLEELAKEASKDYSEYPAIRKYISKSREMNHSLGYKNKTELLSDFHELDMAEIEMQFRRAKKAQQKLKDRIESIHVMNNGQKVAFEKELAHLKNLQSHAYNTVNNQLNNFLDLLRNKSLELVTSDKTTTTSNTSQTELVSPFTPPIVDTFTDDTSTEPTQPEDPITTAEHEVQIESATSLSQIKNRVAVNNLKFSRAQTALYSKKTVDGYTEFKRELSEIVVNLNSLAEDIADLEFQKEEFVANKSGTPETPEQKGKRSKRNEESRKKFESEKTTLNDKVTRLTGEINKIIGGGKSLEDIIKEIGVSNADKLIKISDKAKLTKAEADEVLSEIKEALKKKSTDKGFSDSEKMDFEIKLSILSSEEAKHKESLNKITPNRGNIVEAARYGVATTILLSISETISKAQETLEKKNEISADEKFEKYQKALKEERVKMVAKKLEIQKLDLEYKAGVEEEKIANKKEKLSILAQVEAEKKLAKAEHRKPNLTGIDTAALKVLRPLRRFFQFKHKAYKLNRESLCNEARGLMDEVTYNYHHLAEFEGVELNEENSVNFIKTFARSPNFKNKTETKYEIDSTSDVITEKGALRKSFGDMLGNMLEDGNGWGAVGAGLVMGAAIGTAAVVGGTKSLFTKNPNGSAPVTASKNASQTANSINHPAPEASTRNSGARTAAYIGGGAGVGAAAVALAMSGAAAQAPTADTTKILTTTSTTTPAAATATPKKTFSIKEKENTLHFADQDKNFTIRQMKNPDGSTDIVLDMPANYADDNNMAARYEHAKDSLVKEILTNPELKSYRDQISKNGKLLINTGRETNIIVPMTINISDVGNKVETVAEANFENPAMIKLAADRVANRFGEGYKSYKYTA